ncbi:TetR/AcrR family transcriptional regulator [Phenylobacterium sp.]|uniref:TetR/AcrR family transcriptional regulator n=1 Tax=Phenylobacterium sp. TaxID=1871053 RepID=UPI0025DF1777|nr:TetR/AcrR family transcriptional regulator [Phenylobacterium sp.]MBX3481955.1 TetR/AcrR family transcriptional regulator [Phenylobacterium sp.]MCW5759646.1 TetR/AcrR family transcriptional regulator [Phenylobacterium sp.]
MRTKDETKAQDILQATLDEVRDVGLAGLSVEAVARRAGVATGTVYVYFKGKDALLDQLYLRTKQKFATQVLRDDGGPIRAAFTRMTIAYVDYVIENAAELVFMSQMANSPYLTAETREQAAIGLRPLAALLERGKAEHLLKDIDTGWMATFLYETVKSMAPLARGLPPERYREFQETVATLCWDALKA